MTFLNPFKSTKKYKNVEEITVPAGLEEKLKEIAKNGFNPFEVKDEGLLTELKVSF